MEPSLCISAQRTGPRLYRSSEKQTLGISTPMQARRRFCTDELGETNYRLFAFVKNSSPRKRSITTCGTANMQKKFLVMKGNTMVFIGMRPRANHRVPSDR